MKRLAEAVRLIKQLLGGKPVTFAGQHYQVRELSAGFKPVQQPHLPIVIGGGGRGLLRLAAEEADVISIMPRSRTDGSGLEDADATDDAFAQKTEWIRHAAGDRFGELELNTLVQAVVITNDRRGAAEQLTAEWQLPADRLLDSPLLLLGSVDEIVASLHHRRERLGISSITIFEKDIDDFARVIERISG